MSTVDQIAVRFQQRVNNGSLGQFYRHRGKITVISLIVAMNLGTYPLFTEIEFAVFSLLLMSSLVINWVWTSLTG
ncbi:MAG: hypothetical protein M8354_06030, partial [Halalkalicoccus sp.]|nr:hypothetical protein [Halalkalicoccus sp.]